MKSISIILSVFLTFHVINGENNVEINDNCIRCVMESYGVETAQNKMAGCNGDVCGQLRITNGYWIDGGSLEGDFQKCALNEACSRQTFINYMNKYAKDCNNDGKINCEDFFRIHHNGPFGCENDKSKPIFQTNFSKCFKLA